MQSGRESEASLSDTAGLAKVYIDGRLLPQDEACISVLDRGFTLGDGVFETMRLSRGKIFRLAEHLTRLRRSAAAIHLTLTVEDRELVEALDRVVDANGLSEAVLRLTISRGVPQGRGLLPTGAVNPTIAIQPSPFTPPSTQKYEEGFRAITASVHRNELSPLAYIKSCNYLDNVLARIEAADSRADEGIMLNTAGQVACGASSNIFGIKAGELFTPSIQSGVLAGITRAAMIELAAQKSMPVSEGPVIPADLLSCDECFLTNTVLGVMPLVVIDGQEIGTGKPGPWTKELKEAYEDLVKANI